MYEDKLDGVIDEMLFKRKADENRAQQAKLAEQIERHQQANQNYIEDGTRLLDLANRAAEIFERQPATEKRKLLRFVVDRCTWKNGQLEFEYRKPFDLIAEFDQAQKTKQLKMLHSNRNGHGGSTVADGPEVEDGRGVTATQVLAGEAVRDGKTGQNDNWLARNLYFEPFLGWHHDSRPRDAMM